MVHEVFPYKGYHPLLTKAIRFAHNVIEKLRNLSAVITPTDELAAVYGGKAKITAPILNLPPLELLRVISRMTYAKNMT